MEVLTALGLMSGTSMDGIDVGLLRTDGQKILERGPFVEFPYDEDFRALLARSIVDAKAMTDRTLRPGSLAESESQLTQRHCEAVDSFLLKHALSASDIDVIGFHGQTVLHRPEIGLTVQIGDGAELARSTGIQVVADLRGADMLAGGQGAPVAPAYHGAIASSLSERPAVFVNIGGVSNVTFVDDKGALLAFDTGPGNVLIDEWMLEHTGAVFDNNGEVAATGKVHDEAIRVMLDNSYFEQAPPKSLDRYDFTAEAVSGLSLEDGAATLTAFTAASLLRAQEHFPSGMPEVKAWIICGGGARNPTLMRALKDYLPGRVETADAIGLNSASIEAEAFAYLAVRSLKGLPLTFPLTTGCRVPVTGGVLYKA